MTPITQGGSVTWNISRLYVEEPAGAIAPAEVLSGANPFEVKVDFSGSGAAWTVFEMSGTAYTANFHFERLGGAGSGVGTPEYDSPAVPGTLGPVATATYTAAHTVPANTLTPGVYRLSCLIDMGPGSGVIGFEEGLVISVS